MKRALCFAVLCVSVSGPLAAESTVLPKGTFLLDLSYLQSSLNMRYDNDRQRLPLIDDIPRYEPGGGLQGILGARPAVTFRLIVMQLGYAITDDLLALVYLPIVVNTAISANFSWQPGDYQSQLGRAYSQDDFWAWAGSLGQPKPPDYVVTNKGVLADMIIGLRYRLPFEFLRKIGLQVAGSLAVALPTGKSPDPEELLVAGTTSWELHAYGDVEVHLAADRPFFTNQYGVGRLNLGTDLYYAFFRPRTLQSPKGLNNPLLQNFAPYIGDTYTIDPGDWFVATASLDIAPFFGPTRASIVSGGDLEKAEALPPLATLTLAYQYIATTPTNWTSNSPLWDYDREKLWGPGDKQAFKATFTLSFMRLGLPLQAYVSYRAQDLLSGRNTRASNTFAGGIRAVAKFW